MRSDSRILEGEAAPGLHYKEQNQVKSQRGPPPNLDSVSDGPFTEVGVEAPFVPASEMSSFRLEPLPRALGEDSMQEAPLQWLCVFSAISAVSWLWEQVEY